MVYLQQCLVVTWLVPRDMFHPAFCHVDIDVCIYSTVFDGQVDADVDNVILMYAFIVLFLMVKWMLMLIM